jgi:hypothetical protein
MPDAGSVRACVERSRRRRRCLTALAALALLAADCGGGAQAAGLVLPARPALHEATPDTDGANATAEGFTFASSMGALGPDGQYSFQILGPDGTPQRSLLLDQTKYIHLLGVRDDLTDFVHVHPVMAPDGTWSVRLPFQSAGPHELYADFLIDDLQGTPRHLVLHRPVMVPGPYRLAPVLPAPSLSGAADGYSITFRERPRAWTVMIIPAVVTHEGQPVRDLQPYLSAYAHFTAFAETTRLYGHAHPLEYTGTGYDQSGPGWEGGPDLSFHAEFPGSGYYRAFVEFQTGGALHTAALTLHVD